MIAWPADRAGEVLEQFRRVSSEAPESLGAVFRYLAVPDLEAVPAPLRGRRVAAVIAAQLGEEADGLLRPLRATEGSLLDTFGPVGPADLVRIAGDPEAPAPARGDGFMVDRLDAGLVDAIATLIAEDALGPLFVLELRLLGGALARAPEGAGALAKLDAAFGVFAGGPAFDAETATAIDERLDHLSTRLAPWTAPQALLNSARGGIHPARAYDPETWTRLRRARDTYDPDRLILSNHADPDG
jgi:hypothetical protein